MVKITKRIKCLECYEKGKMTYDSEDRIIQKSVSPLVVDQDKDFMINNYEQLAWIFVGECRLCGVKQARIQIIEA